LSSSLWLASEIIFKAAAINPLQIMQKGFSRKITLSVACRLLFLLHYIDTFNASAPLLDAPKEFL